MPHEVPRVKRVADIFEKLCGVGTSVIHEGFRGAWVAVHELGEVVKPPVQADEACPLGVLSCRDPLKPARLKLEKESLPALPKTNQELRRFSTSLQDARQ